MSVRDVIQAAAGASGGSSTSLYVEDVFSTNLYTGNGASRTINNGIDLVNNGGSIWIKRRFGGSGNWSDHWVFDSLNNSGGLRPNSNQPKYDTSPNSPTFNASGFNLTTYPVFNESTTNYVSWTFRKAPKFFDVVTWTGNGASTRIINHSLGATPYFIMVKRLDASSNWRVAAYDPGIGGYQFLKLNLTDASTIDAGGYAADGNSTRFILYSSGGDVSAVNANGGTYVAYLFASNAGGFGASGTDSIISCGSFTTNASNLATVNLGWEPQYLLMKRTDFSHPWLVMDTSRISGGNYEYLTPNSADVGYADVPGIFVPSATGFTTNGIYNANTPFVYLAIRKNMKV